MPNEDDLREVRLEVERIKDRLDDIRHIQALQVRADVEIGGFIREYFSGTGGSTKAKIYLAVNGIRSVTEIADHVHIAQPHVTRKAREMYELGLLQWRTDGARKVYEHSVVERALRLSRHLKSIANSP